jgi:AbrB family looped-hinge helix DNA binding protein
MICVNGMSYGKGGGRRSIEECFIGSVTVGERGQIVIPKEAREEFDIQPGMKLLAMRDPVVNGIMLVKLDEVAKMQDHFASLLAQAQQSLEEDEE